MVGYDQETYTILRTSFNREIARIEPYKSRRELTKSLEKRQEYKTCLVQTFNDLAEFFHSAHKEADLEGRLQIEFTLADHLNKLKESFKLLRLTYEFSRGIYDKIDINKIDQDWTDLDSLSNDSDDKTSDSTHQNTHSKSDATLTDTKTDETSEQSTPNKASTSQTIDTPQIPQRQTDNNSLQLNNSERNDQNNATNMPQSPEDFIALAHRTINYKYAGDPLALDSFIDAISLLETLCQPENKTLCIKFIMTKLEGEAREAIETDPTEITEISEALKKNIKPESSKVIEGRILALRADKTSLVNFSQRAEELAEQYRRSLITEGYTKPMAKQLAIDKTVDLCRRSTRHDRVKAIIGGAAATFTDPKEVIAKMINEINNLKLDNSMTPGNNNNHKKNNKSFKQNGGNNYGNKQNNYRQQGSSNSQNNGNGRQNSGNGNGNGQRGNRGNYSNNGNGNGRTFYNSNNNNNSRRQNDQQLRYYQGNEVTPSSGGHNSENNQ